MWVGSSIPPLLGVLGALFCVRSFMADWGGGGGNLKGGIFQENP